LERVEKEFSLQKFSIENISMKEEQFTFSKLNFLIKKLLSFFLKNCILVDFHFFSQFSQFFWHQVEKRKGVFLKNIFAKKFSIEEFNFYKEILTY